MASSRTESRLPVFVFPEQLSFSERLQKIVLTLYNPYDFPLRFHILCNVPEKYSVQDSHGVLKPHYCVDIVIRHQQASQGPWDTTDKFRIDLYQGNRLMGRKHLNSSLTKHTLPSKPDGIENQQDSSEYHAIPSSTSPPKQQKTAGIQSSPGWLTMLVGVVSLLVLLLPLEGEGMSWPYSLHVTVNQKLIAAFILGLVTMVILRT